MGVGGWSRGISVPSAPNTKAFYLVCPVFFDVEVPFPGQEIVLVVVGELGFDDVLAARHQSCGSFFQRSQEVVFGITRPIAAHHVVCLINCGHKKVDTKPKTHLITVS